MTPLPEKIVPVPLEGFDDLPEAEAWALGLKEPFDDAPDFDGDSPEVNTFKRLANDRSLITRPTGRTCIDFRCNPDAYRHLATLPAEGESLHGVISGKYALWELVPAIIERTGQTIEDLTIATLSFSESNAAHLLSLIDAGKVKHVGLLISYFFKAQNRKIYDALVPQLRERGHRVLAMRTHCKLILAELADGTKYTVESSANLRSSVNVEQFVMTNDTKLYDFHRQWIYDELLTGTELGEQ
jgi:hypothetical protein